MISLDSAAHVAELVGGITTTIVGLGVSVWLKRGWSIGRAIAHTPQMLHEHTESSGPLTKEGIVRPFAEKAG